MGAVTDDNGKSPSEQAMEVFVYAPIGLLFEGSTLLPLLVERGRNQVTMARMIGKFAVEQGRSEATKTVSKLGDQAAGLLDFLGDSLTPAVDEPAPPPAKSPTKRPASTGRAMAAAKTTAKPGATPAAPAEVAGPAVTTAPEGEGADAVTTLAITDYDGLSASHVVNRLAGLSAEELEAVRRYEAANRGRKTILSKIAQLQSR
jgi:hypothetical protein